MSERSTGHLGIESVYTQGEMHNMDSIARTRGHEHGAVSGMRMDLARIVIRAYSRQHKK